MLPGKLAEHACTLQPGYEAGTSAKVATVGTRFKRTQVTYNDAIFDGDCVSSHDVNPSVNQLLIPRVYHECYLLSTPQTYHQLSCQFQCNVKYITRGVSTYHHSYGEAEWLSAQCVKEITYLLNRQV